MTWFKQLKFAKNPLDIRPNSLLIGLDEAEEHLKNHIIKEEICFLNGLTGSGKTSMLTKIQKNMTDHEFIYIDAQQLPDNFNLIEELSKKKGILDKLLFRKFPKKKPVLIIDEFQDTKKNLILEARSAWENQKNQKIKSIIIAQISKKLSNVTDSFKERIGHRIITLPLLDEDQMKDILKRRLTLNKNKKSIFEKISPGAVDLIIYAAGNNPRRLLEYTDMIFDFHYRSFNKINPVLKPNYKITFHAAKEILMLNNVNVSDFEIKDKINTKSARETDTFDKFYSDDEKVILKYLLTEGASKITEISKDNKITLINTKNIIAALQKKKSIRQSNKKNKKLYEISPEAKRLMVKE